MYKMLITAIVLVVIDGIYLSMMKPYFDNQVKLVQGSALKINITATILCYVFIIQPNKSVQDAFLFGIVIYAVYETTSRALLTKWKWSTVIIDTLWGGVLFALTAWIMKKIK